MSQHFISLEKAKAMTAKYRSKQNHFVKEGLRSKTILPISETFSRDAFDKVLSQPGCTGLRIYYGMDDNDGIHAIIVGINEKNEDMLPASSPAAEVSADNNTASITSNDGGNIIEESKSCPPLCGTTSPLNS